MIAGMNCDGCGFDAPADFSFCPKCGRKLAGPVAASTPAAEADRRTATILFADLTGFTALSERLDPEDVRALQTDLFEEMRAVLLHEDAFIEKYVGDAVMAVFGAPTAHEDDPQRALRCALQLHDSAAALTQRWQQRLRQPLQLHIGINTGRVVAGHIGAAQGAAYAVTGDAVNVASRLQSAAGPGETWLSQETRAQAHDAFEFEPAGSVQLKGKALPLSAFRLVGAAAHAAGALPERQRGARLASRLAGRSEELAQLHAALQTLPGSGARVLSLVGDAGIGKSRLVDELLQQLRGGDVAVQRTGCTAHQVQPYGVAARFFRSGFGLTAADTLPAVQAKVEAGLSLLGAQADEIALVVPMAGYVLGLAGLQELRQLEPERLHRQITMALRIVLDCQLRRSPLLLVVEDIQWADAASLELLSTMADWLHPRPMLLLLTSRPGVDMSGFAAGRAPHGLLPLQPLGPAQIDEALAGCFGTAGLGWMPPALRARLIERAAGNPFFLEEMVRSLIAAGVLVESEAGWSCHERQAAADVPATLEGLLLSRFDRLAPAERRCLQEAAVLGTAFDQGLLQALAGDGFDTSRLDGLCAAGYLASAAPGRYRFCHPIARDVVYQNLLLRRRTELHAQVGRLLEARIGRSTPRFEDLEALGHHLSLGDEPARGARWLVAAGDWARGIYANDDAIRIYQRAHAALGARDDGEARLDIDERLGDLFGPTGRRDSAFEHYSRVRDAARRAGDRPREARIQRKLAALHWDAGARECSRECLDAGLALLAGSDGGIEAAYLLQEMGRFAFRTGDNEAAVQWAERALADAQCAAQQWPESSPERRDASTAAAQAMNTLGAALARLDRTEEAVLHIERSIAIAEAEGQLQAACRGYANLSVLYAGLNPGRAIETCQKGLDMARRIGDLGFQSRLSASLAVAYCALTNQCDIEGLRAAEVAIDLDRQLGQIDHLAVPLIVLAQIHQCHGDPQAALRYFDEARQLAEQMGEPQLLFPVYDGLGTLYLDLGDAAQAESYLLKADEVCAAAGLDRDSLVVLPFLC
jgi:adenylate cyclase